MSSTARDLARRVREGADPRVAVAEAVDRATRDTFGCFLHLDGAAVERQLQSVDRAGALAGVPVALKDNLLDRGQPCGCASRLLAGYLAPYDATVVERLRRAGAIVIGRTNMDEFAMGSSTERSAFGPTHNPRDPTRSPGGSSGGSAAAIAAGHTPLALGSDTGGSARQPAAFCGVVALKPTWGRVSRHGLVAFASSLDAVAPMGADVRDVALLTGVLAGVDPRDATTADSPVPDYLAACGRGVRGLRVALLAEATGDGVEPGVAEAVGRAAEGLRAAGAHVETASVPRVHRALAAYHVLASAEASSNLARYDGVRYGPRWGEGDLAQRTAHTRAEGFGPEVQRRLLLGTWVQTAGRADRVLARARALRAALRADLEALLRGVDLLLTPTAPTVAFPLGDRAADPVAMYLSDVFTVPASLAGLPAISVPCGRVSGLPVGAQLVGRHFDEATLFAAASVVEASCP